MKTVEERRVYAREYYLKNRDRILSPENKENRKKIAKK